MVGVEQQQAGLAGVEFESACPLVIEVDQHADARGHAFEQQLGHSRLVGTGFIRYVGHPQRFEGRQLRPQRLLPAACPAQFAGIGDDHENRSTPEVVEAAGNTVLILQRRRCPCCRRG